ncbi:hypothetical protein [Pseudonocardia sp. ICBG1293]|uniref:hypothetical protein n=1 Tax=Pseudonocardia sp. ICBG1293 TaxID=2844382 RepID=UPI001CCAA9FF|nr:hypothetical protein [Pseudonocardia sp. ICBG1293]
MIRTLPPDALLLLQGEVAKRSFQNEVDVSVVDDKRLSDLPFDLSSRGQWKLDKSF